MNRKTFLQSCACGLSAGAANLVPATSLSAADAKKTEDWRLPFVQRRYAKLLDILSRRMGENTLKETLHELGSSCSGMGDESTKKYRGDLDGLAKSIKQGISGDTVTYDRGKGILTMASEERTSCFCPLLSANAPGLACNCLSLIHI